MQPALRLGVGVLGCIATAAVLAVIAGASIEACEDSSLWWLLIIVAPIASFAFAFPNPTMGRYLFNGLVGSIAAAIVAYDVAWDYIEHYNPQTQACYIEVPVIYLIAGWMTPAVGVLIGAPVAYFMLRWWSRKSPRA
jgi:hypothetical protein